MITLDIETRDVKVNPKHVRNAGRVPGVYYGRGTASTNISVAKLPFAKALAEAGESTIVSLKLGKESIDALIHDVDLDPVTGEPRHVDFYIVSKDRVVEVAVPIEYIGEAPVEKLGGVVMRVMHELEIEALPAALPHSIIVDISVLAKIGDHISVRDLKLPAGVTAVTPESETIVLAEAPREEKEEEVKPVDLSAIEVEQKGKKEEEAEDGESAKAE